MNACKKENKLHDKLHEVEVLLECFAFYRKNAPFFLHNRLIDPQTQVTRISVSVMKDRANIYSRTSLFHFTLQVERFSHVQCYSTHTSFFFFCLISSALITSSKNPFLSSSSERSVSSQPTKRTAGWWDSWSRAGTGVTEARRDSHRSAPSSSRVTRRGKRSERSSSFKLGGTCQVMLHRWW